MVRVTAIFLILAAAFGLAGCNETMNGSAAGPVASVPVHAPGGAACAAPIDRFQAIVTSDRDTGNVDPSVYQQIEADLSRASAACAAGRTGESNAIVAASKARHGYRA